MDTNGAIERSARRMQAWFKKETGGRVINFDTSNGRLDVSFHPLQLNTEQLRILEGWSLYEPSAAWQEAGFDSSKKIYAVYMEGRQKECGHAQVNYLIVFLHPTCGGRNPESRTLVPMDLTLGHEALHAMGAAPICAPHLSEKHSHVTDDATDILAHKGTFSLARTIDQARDDYFGHSIEGCPDIADSPFLSPSPGSQKPWWFDLSGTANGGFEVWNDGLPENWSGDSEEIGVGIGKEEPGRDGSKASVRLAGLGLDDYSGVSQCHPGGRYRNKSLVFSGYLKTQDVKGVGASIFLAAKGWKGGNIEYIDTFQLA
ncbi:MAG: hypothetical protein ACRD1T_24050, partial [Acidimicrobiia bacterium]